MSFFFDFFKRRKKVGLALSGGNARGIAHIGVIKALKENNIPIDFISGTSAGSFVGGFYSFFGDINELENMISNIGYKEILNILLDPFASRGLIKGDKFLSFLKKSFDSTKIENLKIPFQATVTDFISGKPHFLNKGDLALAIRASSSVPLFFDPVKISDHLFIDGGFTVPIPVQNVRKMGADFVIAVDLYNKVKYHEENDKNPVSIATSSIDLLFKSLAQENIKTADIVINPKLPNYNQMNFFKSKNFIEFGYKETLKSIPKIKNLLGL